MLSHFCAPVNMNRFCNTGKKVFILHNLREETVLHPFLRHEHSDNQFR